MSFSIFISISFSSVQSLRRVQLFVSPPGTAVHQASLSITSSQSLLKLTSIESVMPSNHFILCRPLLPSIFPSIRVFSNESVLCIRGPKYWSFSFNISPSKGFPGSSDSKVSGCNSGDLGSIAGWENPLEKEMATHSSTLAWKIPWIEEPGRLQSMGSQRVRHD